jgi:hypothetical protein
MTDAAANAADNTTKSMDDIMALCKRRGFIFQASEIYGGIQGFWDYGPLGAQLKKNLRDAWWNDVVMLGCNGQNGPTASRSASCRWTRASSRTRRCGRRRGTSRGSTTRWWIAARPSRATAPTT